MKIFRHRLVLGGGVALLAVILTMCTFGPLDRKLSLLRVEPLTWWSPAASLSSSWDDGWSFPAVASGQSFAFVQRTFKCASPSDAVAGQLEALRVAEDDGWHIGPLSDPAQTREKNLLLGVAAEFGVHVDPDDKCLVVLTLKAFE